MYYEREYIKKINTFYIRYLQCCQYNCNYCGYWSCTALGGTLLSQIMRPGYLAKQMINAEMELVFSEWVVLLVCFIIKCSCIFLAIRYSKKLFYCISKQESPFTANTTKCINIIAVFTFVSMVCPLYPYYHISFLSIIEGIFVVLIFRSITLIFKYGCSLQKEIDETL